MYLTNIHKIYATANLYKNINANFMTRWKDNSFMHEFAQPMLLCVGLPQLNFTNYKKIKTDITN